MKIKPESLRTNVVVRWAPGNPPQPLGDVQHIWGIGEDGNLYHKWWAGVQWSPWENLGQPTD